MDDLKRELQSIRDKNLIQYFSNIHGADEYDGGEVSIAMREAYERRLGARDSAERRAAWHDRLETIIFCGDEVKEAGPGLVPSGTNRPQVVPRFARNRASPRGPQ